MPHKLNSSRYLLTVGVIRYIPWSEENGAINACGIPIDYNASKEWANKKVVLFSVPGKLSVPEEPTSATVSGDLFGGSLPRNI